MRTAAEMMAEVQRHFDELGMTADAAILLETEATIRRYVSIRELEMNTLEERVIADCVKLLSRFGRPK